MTVWGYTFSWRDQKGAVNTVTVSKAESPGAAVAQCLTMARASGYQRPRWWQWRRWREVDIEKFARQLGGGFPGFRVSMPRPNSVRRKRERFPA